MIKERLLTMNLINTDKSVQKGRKAWRSMVVLATILSVGFLFLQSGTYTPFRGEKPVQESTPYAQKSFVSEREDNSLLTRTEPIESVDVIIKPLAAEVGVIILSHIVGFPMLSIVGKVLLRARRLRWIGRIHKMHLRMKITARLVHRSSKISRVFRRLQKTVKTVTGLYRKRSQLSVASEYTNLIGNGNSIQPEEDSASRNEAIGT